MSALEALWQEQSAWPSDPLRLWGAIADDLYSLLDRLVAGDADAIASRLQWVEQAVVVATSRRSPLGEGDGLEVKVMVGRAMDLAGQIHDVASACAGVLKDTLTWFQRGDLPPGTLFHG